MKFNIDTSGLDKLKKNLDEIEKEGEHSVPLSDLINREFLSKHAPGFSSFEDMLEKSSFTVSSVEDFTAIPDEEFDSFISQNSVFNNWRDMQVSAAKDYYIKKLGF